MNRRFMLYSTTLVVLALDAEETGSHAKQKNIHPTYPIALINVRTIPERRVNS